MSAKTIRLMRTIWVNPLIWKDPEFRRLGLAEKHDVIERAAMVGGNDGGQFARYFRFTDPDLENEARSGRSRGGAAPRRSAAESRDN